MQIDKVAATVTDIVKLLVFELVELEARIADLQKQCEHHAKLAEELKEKDATIQQLRSEVEKSSQPHLEHKDGGD